MADAVNTVLGIRSYKGDSTAGGSQSFGITLDTTPFDRLAQFSYYQNREKWERQNKLDDEQALEIAKVAALDPSSSRPEVYKYLSDKKNALLEKISKGGLDYQKNPELFVEFRKELGEFGNESTVAKALEAKEIDYQAKMAATTDVDEKNDIQAQYEDEIARIYGGEGGVKAALTQKGLMKSYNPTASESLALPDFEGSIVYKEPTIGYNNNIETKYTFLDLDGLGKAIDVFLIGGENFVPSEAAKKNPEEYKKEKRAFDKQYRNPAKIKEDADLFDRMTQDAVAKIRDAKNDPAKIKEIIRELKKTAGGDVADGLTRILEVNGQIEEANRVSRRNSGSDIYEPIDIFDGIDAKEFLRQKALFGKTLLKAKEADITSTGAGTTAENNRMDNAVQWYNAKTSRITATKPTTVNPTTGAVETQSAYDSVVNSIFNNAVQGKTGRVALEMPIRNLTVEQAYAINPNWVTKKDNGLMSFTEEFNNQSAAGVKIFKTADVKNADGTTTRGSLGYDTKDKKKKVVPTRITAQQVDDAGVGLIYQLPNTKQDGTGIYGTDKSAGAGAATNAGKKYKGVGADGKPIFE